MKRDFIYALKERIGNPNFFTGREKEMTMLLKWLYNIENEFSKSTALLARRKSGKTAMLERLFNILWNDNGKIIPFYYEIKEGNQWINIMTKDYFVTFVKQYLSFKLRDINIIQKDIELKPFFHPE